MTICSSESCKFRTHFGVCTEPAVRMVQFAHMDKPVPMCSSCYDWLEEDERQKLVVNEPLEAQEDNICQTCDGTGDNNGHICKDCGGKGYLNG